MKKKPFYYLPTFLLSCTLLLTGCHKTNSTQIYQEREAFDDYLNHIFACTVNSDSLTLNYTLLDSSLYGIDACEPTLGEYTLESMKKENEQKQFYLDGLSDYNYKYLTKDQQLCYDMLKNRLSLDLKYADYTLYHEILGPTTGLQAQLPILLAEYNFNTKSDIDRYLELIKDTPRYFNQICAMEHLKSTSGLFMSDAVAKEIINQCNAFIQNKDSNYLIEYFDAKLDSLTFLSDSERTSYQKKNKEFVLTYMIPSYENLIATLTNLLGTGTNDQGLYYYKNGKSYYEYLVKSKTGTSHTMTELAHMLDETLYEVLIDISSYAKSESDLSSRIEAYTYIETEPAKILNYLKEEIQKDFPALPNVNCSIKYVHPSLQDYISPAMYLIPPIDSYNENTIYINTNPMYDMSEIFTTIAHEGYPGHLYQCVYYRSKDVHPVRNVITNLGYEEGWATYAELYSYNLGGLDSSVAAILQDNMIATHCIYSRADIGIHYEGWSKEKTQQYLSSYVSKEARESIYSTLLEEPAIYLPYSIGYLEISELKEIANKSLGDKFNLKDFHTFLLDLGPVDFTIAKSSLSSWLKEQK